MARHCSAVWRAWRIEGIIRSIMRDPASAALEYVRGE
jgi:hypothetical protein